MPFRRCTRVQKSDGVDQPQNPIRQAVMEIIPLEIVNDHLVGEYEGSSALFDTGSPMTMEAPELASEELGQPIDRLVGTDVLGSRPFVVDWPGRRLILDPPPLDGVSLDLASVLGVPTITMLVQGQAVDALLDTGAPLSYGPASAFEQLEPSGRRTDFYPMVGRFETETYRLPVTVGERTFDCTFGMLPSILSMLLPLAGTEWILGADFFRGRAILLDLDGHRAIDVTDALGEADPTVSAG